MSCGLYYQHITIVNDNPSIVNKFEDSLTDDARVVIYDRYMFIVQASMGRILIAKGVSKGLSSICNLVCKDDIVYKSLLAVILRVGCRLFHFRFMSFIKS